MIGIGERVCAITHPDKNVDEERKERTKKYHHTLFVQLSSSVINNFIAKERGYIPTLTIDKRLFRFFSSSRYPHHVYEQFNLIRDFR